MTQRVHVYEASVVWTGDRGQGTSAYGSYGRDHVARATGKPDLLMSADPAFRGDPMRYNPEELLVAAISSCHMLWYLHLCASARIIVASYEDKPTGRLVEGNREGGGRFETVLLRPEVVLRSGDVEAARRLHQDAHKECYIANSVNFPVLCEPKVTLA